MSYTLGQFRGFVTAAERSVRREDVRLALAARAAQYDGDSFKKYLKALENG